MLPPAIYDFLICTARLTYLPSLSQRDPLIKSSLEDAGPTQNHAPLSYAHLIITTKKAPN